MSMPFHKTKAGARRLWGPKEPLVKVWVPASRGFLQARKSGYYWVSRDQARSLKLKVSK